MHSELCIRFLAALAFAATLGAGFDTFAQAPAQKEKEEYTPVVGQEGKDVIWVPTPEKTVDRMLSVANVGEKDFVIDLGSGDGRIVIAAAKRGAQAFGVDLNPNMVKLSENRAAREGVTARAKFYVRDIFETDVKQATVITMYLLPQLNLRLRPTILDMKPGTRIVSHAFDMAEWEPDVSDTSTGNSVRMWIVPAKVSGAWTWQMKSGAVEKNVAFEIDQKFQKISGGIKADGAKMSVRDAKLNGDQISFTVLEESGATTLRHDFSGHVNGNAIEGSMKSSNGPTARWTAARRAG